MSELIKRLRDYQIGDVADYVERHPEICDEAAARIEELEAADAMIVNTCDLVARIEHLEAVLRKITKSIGNRVWMQQLAREGLETTT